MGKYREFVLVAAMFGIVLVAALAASGSIDHAFGSLADALAWLTR